MAIIDSDLIAKVRKSLPSEASKMLTDEHIADIAKTFKTHGLYDKLADAKVIKHKTKAPIYKAAAKGIEKVTDMATSNLETNTVNKFNEAIVKKLENGELTPDKARSELHRFNKEWAKIRSKTSKPFQKSMNNLLNSTSKLVAGMTAGGTLLGLGALTAGVLTKNKNSSKNNPSNSGGTSNSGGGTTPPSNKGQSKGGNF